MPNKTKPPINFYDYLNPFPPPTSEDLKKAAEEALKIALQQPVITIFPISNTKFYHHSGNT